MDELMAQRRAKLGQLRQARINPFPARFENSHSAVAVLSQFKDLPAEGTSSQEVSFAGRMVTRRDMGKAAFAHLQDRTGKIQFYIRRDEAGGASYDLFKNQTDLGDILGVAGVPFRTKTGEITLRVKSWTMLSKALRPPPEKFHGITDVEVRYRQREVDLFSNDTVYQRFLTRAKIVAALRETLKKKGFIEVETPILQAVDRKSVV